MLQMVFAFAPIRTPAKMVRANQVRCLHRAEFMPSENPKPAYNRV